MEATELLLKHLSWPVTAVICLVIISVVVKNRILELINSVSKITKELKDIDAHIVSIGKLRDATKALTGDLEEIRHISDTIQGAALETKENFEDIDQRLTRSLSILQEKIALLAPPQKEENAVAVPAGDFSPSEGVSTIKSDWQKVVDRFRSSSIEVGIQFDARSIGREAIAFSDRRRSICLDKDAALEISELHSIYKGYIRFQSNAADWLTRQDVDEFHHRVSLLVPKIRFFQN